MATVEDNWAVSYKTEHVITYDLAVEFIGIYTKKLKTYINTKLTQMFTAILFIISKTQI